MKLLFASVAILTFSLFCGSLQAQSCCAAKATTTSTKTTSCNQAASTATSTSANVQTFDWVAGAEASQTVATPAKETKSCSPADCKPADKNCTPANCQPCPPASCTKSNKASLKKGAATSTAMLEKKSDSQQ